MTAIPRLDRLSALLGGLAPRVQVMRPAQREKAMHFAAEASRGLWLHVVMKGEISVCDASGTKRSAASPSMVICRADVPHDLHAAPADALFPEGLLCTRAHLEGPVAALLLAEFEQPMVVPLSEAYPSLQLVIALMNTEVNEPRCGQPLLLDRAGDILFIGLLRHLVSHPGDNPGLIHGLADPRIANVLVALHAEPQADWRLELMAEQAGMSRTAFANRFREALNTTPGKYLSQLRLAIAQRAVAAGDGLKVAARRTGYNNASALSRALSKAKSDAEAVA